MWNVGWLTLPLNNNPVWHRQRCCTLTQGESILCFNRYAIVHFTSKQLSHFVKQILIICQKRAVNSLFETASELKKTIDPLKSGVHIRVVLAGWRRGSHLPLL